MEKTVLGKYQLQSILGEGGMGVVYRAYDPHLARVVAIKTIRGSLLEGQSGHELRERFRREARAEGRLIHQNIIPIYEYHEDAKGTPFFVMEFVDGRDLKHCLSRGTPFSLDESLNIIEQVLRALAFSHKNGIVHRDIKPANILLLEDGSVKIADFGIAKMEESEYTRSGMILGTPQYCSPEQMVGGMVDARADLYSTGAVLYELITGKKAFSVDSSRKGKRKIRSDISFHSASPKADRILSQVVAKALSKEADDRFLSAEEFLQALQAARPGKRDDGGNLFLGLGTGIGSGIALLSILYHFLPPNLLVDFDVKNREANRSERVESEPVLLSPDQQALLDKYLQVANIHMRVGRLVHPGGSNAMESYKMALQIHPQDQTALNGMTDIGNQLADRIQQLLDEGNSQEAQIELEAALPYFPEDSRFKHFNQKIQTE